MSWSNLLFKKNTLRYRFKIIISIVSIILGISLFIATIISSYNIKQQLLELVKGNYANANILIEYDSSNFHKIDAKLNDIKEIVGKVPEREEEGYFVINNKINKIVKFGIDFDLEEKFGGVYLLIGRIPISKDECIISKRIQQDCDIKLGDKIIVHTNKKQESYNVVGISDNKGLYKMNNFYCVLTRLHDNPNQTRIYTNEKVNIQKINEVINDKIDSYGSTQLLDNNNLTQQKEISIFFGVIMSFAGFILIMGYILMYYSLKNYTAGMKQKISILKALGTSNKQIFLLLMKFPAFILLVSIFVGYIVGVLASKIIIYFGDINLGLDYKGIKLHINHGRIIEFIIISIIIGLVISIPENIKVCKLNVMDGLKKFVTNTKIANKHRKYIISIMILSLFIFLLLFMLNILDKFIFIILFTILFIGIVISKVTKYYYKFIFFLRKKKNGKIYILIYNKIKISYKKVCLIIFLIVFMTSTYLATNSMITGLNMSIRQMVNGIYYGDIILKPLYGKGINEEVIKKLEKNKQKKEIISDMKTYKILNNIGVQIIGYTINSDISKYLMISDNLSEDKIQKLNNDNFALVSELTLNLNKWKIGEYIDIGGRELVKIAATYQSPRNNGKSMIISDNTFKNIFDDYHIDHINIIKKDSSVTDKEFVNSITKALNGELVEMKSAEKMRDYEFNNNGKFILIFKGMTYLYLIVIYLLIISLILEDKKENIESEKVGKLLGMTKKQIMDKSVIEGFLLYMWGIVISLPVYLVIKHILIDKINSTIYWGLKIPNMQLSILLYFIIGFIIIILTELITSFSMYNDNFKYYE